MPSKSYFSYVRVSTQKQGQRGTSLIEQTDAIERFARRWNLHIVKRYEERETAAKTGRPVFLEMLKALKLGEARGLIVHKIDRSARNLKDWAELGSLIDLGVEVHFANESLDLSSRGGRLSADIQAVVAADYVRNLREEAKKGLYGRIKQGLYPFPAPVGYLDMGQGKPKRIDPILGPLVKQAFEVYARGELGLDSLVEEMYQAGFTGKNGSRMSRNGMVKCLRNPFYIGLVSLRSLREVFVGQHEPIISKELFDQVQEVLAGKRVKKSTKHYFVYRRHVRCGSCGKSLIGERQKGHVYYRCHTRGCVQSPFREEAVSKEFLQVLREIEFSNEETEYLRSEIIRHKDSEPKRIDCLKRELSMRSEQIAKRMENLADAYMDGVFDKETYLDKKNKLTLELSESQRKLNDADNESGVMTEKLEEFLELLKQPYLSYKNGNDREKRELARIVSSNFVADGNNLLIKLNIPFDLVHSRPRVPFGGPTLATYRTFQKLYKQLFDFFRNPMADLPWLKNLEN
ncbi:MAG: recombinase family protein [Chloracidobacterium sp.]|nr:recombinase family protein [Chloracidobacterium sp.]